MLILKIAGLAIVMSVVVFAALLVSGANKIEKEILTEKKEKERDEI